MILMAFFTGMPVILTEDSDIEMLRTIARRKIASESYELNIYNAVNLLIIIAEKEETNFGKDDLVKVVKMIGESKHKSEVKQAWNRAHLEVEVI